MVTMVTMITKIETCNYFEQIDIYSTLGYLKLFYLSYFWIFEIVPP